MGLGNGRNDMEPIKNTLQDVILKLKEIMEKEQPVTLISKVGNGLSHLYYGKILYLDEIGNIGVRCISNDEKQQGLLAGLTINCQDFNEYHIDEHSVSMSVTHAPFGHITIIFRKHLYRYWGRELDPGKTYFIKKT